VQKIDNDLASEVDVAFANDFSQLFWDSVSISPFSTTLDAFAESSSLKYLFNGILLEVIPSV
jgi:hypothetical protein